MDAGAVEGEGTSSPASLPTAASTDGVLFVVDQDLRAPEVAAIKRLMHPGKPIYVVLNKADQFTAADRDAILVSIRAKMPKDLPQSTWFRWRVAPRRSSARSRMRRGAVRIELRRPAADIRALINLLARNFPPAPGGCA